MPLSSYKTSSYLNKGQQNSIYLAKLHQLIYQSGEGNRERSLFPFILPLQSDAIGSFVCSNSEL